LLFIRRKRAQVIDKADALITSSANA